jgi:hypothetical protein
MSSEIKKRGPGVVALERQKQRQENYEFETTLAYMVRSPQ